MATKFVSIGSADHVHVYDDGDADAGVHTDHVMVAEQAPTNPNEVLRLDDVGDLIIQGPVSSTDNAVVRWDGATGKKIQDSLVIIDDSGNITIPDGAGIGQVSGPHVVWDETNGYLEITNCDVGVGTSTPAYKLDVQGGDVNTSGVYRVDSDQVVGAQQAPEANIGPAYAPTVSAGSDTIIRTELNSALTQLAGYINTTMNTINSLLGKLRTHGLIDT